ncbi:putative toxin-antitoxin system toxin component, PIN family [Ancylothrix sp. C2]|uniref:putative toxin-antitoxin system toxin component, PIN family n=1 Tax=Ancylothrix sp. D3o TaxID=2953691 RepID=UPI0021BA55A8|nr:putative toxin-antitoxin system toxin component, PIN family [Ancylothrix sp. D3o]MCT7950551.1 putative toxin-antitoxin system toxin component, PIN family [Ancylothrix sp. D3o]
MKVVLDVNVWVSALLWGGVPARIFALARNQQITIFVSEPLLIELETTLRRSKFQQRIEQRGYTVESLLFVTKALSQMCPTILVEVPQLRDQDDAKILAAGVAAGVEVIVTGDLDLLTLIEFQNIAILTPHRFLDCYFRPA